VSVRTALVNAARGLVKSYGERLPKCGTEQVSRELAAALSTELRDVLEPLLTEIESLNERIKEYDERMEKIAKEVYPEVSLLKQVKGVGTQIALTYVLTIEDPHRFLKSREVGCFFCGLSSPEELREVRAAKKSTYLATLQKPVWIFYRQDIRQRDLRSYPLHLLEQGHFRVHFLGDVLHALVVFLDALVQRFDFCKQRLQNIPHSVLNARPAPGSPAPCTLGQSFTVRLHQPRAAFTRPFEHSPVQLAPGLPSDGFALVHCDAAPAPKLGIDARQSCQCRASCRSSFDCSW